MKKITVRGAVLLGIVLFSSCAGPQNFTDSLRRTDRSLADRRPAAAENYRYPQTPDPQGTSEVWSRPVTTDSSAHPTPNARSTEPTRDDSQWDNRYGYRANQNLRYYRENQATSNQPSAWMQEQIRLEELGELVAQAIDQAEDGMDQVEARMMNGNRRARLDAEADLVALAEVREALFRTYLKVNRRGNKDLPTLEREVQELLRDARELNDALSAAAKP
ncbi:hypothetical protein GCM10027275_37450 [Rhabdobacter roseus]|uniref:Lipoprotein n=1 Tax=Rhabdobacter roseus TaxID=1655419 RepID=A0A840TW81_9BACT|nr:hypothetical protein [Rhabdobacter roseus]MBB5285847.1 hypothetical protein [Rhabdobacter roseus]